MAAIYIYIYVIASDSFPTSMYNILKFNLKSDSIEIKISGRNTDKSLSTIFNPSYKLFFNLGSQNVRLLIF